MEEQKLDGVVKLPSGVFKPYAGVSTAILLFTKTNSGSTDQVWFYDVRADGSRWTISATRWRPMTCRTWSRAGLCVMAPNSSESAPSNPSACPRNIVAQGYDLSLNRYKEIVHDEVEHRPPLETPTR